MTRIGVGSLNLFLSRLRMLFSVIFIFWIFASLPLNGLSNQAFGATDRYVMIVDEKLKAMIYKRGLLLNSWSAFEVQGFAAGSKVIPFTEFAERAFIEDNPFYKVSFFGKKNSVGSCRIRPTSTSKGKRLQFYNGDGSSRRYIVFDDREDYLKFSCYKESK